MLISLLVTSITGLVFNTTQKMLTSVENRHLSLHVYICLKRKGNIDVTALTIIQP